MRQSRRRLETHRTCRFEVMESRLLLSTSPATPLAAAVTNAAITAGNHDAWAGLDAVRAKYALSGQGQTVVVIDTGIDYAQTALGGGFGPGYRVVGGYDFTTGSGNPYDGGPAGGHGTEVAGVIGSNAASDLGVAPGVDLVALKVIDNNGNGSAMLVDEALQWVNAHRNSFPYPITTVDLSLGNDSNAETLPPGGGFESDLAQLQADGMFISVAAGNDFATFNQPGLSYPAVSPDVVPVAAGNLDGTIAAFSQRDPRVLVAPGANMLTTVPDYAGNPSSGDNGFGLYSGTSMAAAFVAGASVLVRQADQLAGMSNVNEQTIYNQMYSTADIIFDPATGQNYHRLNLQRAIDAIMAGIQPPPAASGSGSAPTAAAVDQLMQTTGTLTPSANSTSSAQTGNNSVVLNTTSKPATTTPVAAVSTSSVVKAPTAGIATVKLPLARTARLPASSTLPALEVLQKSLVQIRNLLT